MQCIDSILSIYSYQRREYEVVDHAPLSFLILVVFVFFSPLLIIIRWMDGDGVHNSQHMSQELQKASVFALFTPVSATCVCVCVCLRNTRFTIEYSIKCLNYRYSAKIIRKSPIGALYKCNRPVRWTWDLEWYRGVWDFKRPRMVTNSVTMNFRPTTKSQNKIKFIMK